MLYACSLKELREIGNWLAAYCRALGTLMAVAFVVAGIGYMQYPR